ncbi:hypothetical protein JW859_10920 [bacterium]|nr:hypothetical protein [bacterium]
MATSLSKAAPQVVTTGGFELSVSPDTYLTEASSARFVLDVAEQTGPDAIAVTISTENAIDLRALYCELHYDPARYSPAGVEHLDWAEDLLTLDVATEPGVVYVGQVMANWDERTGLNGDAELARVSFKREPMPETGRGTSQALTAETGTVMLRIDSLTKRVAWNYDLPGDYNQDGLVGVADLTPLAANLDRQYEAIEGNGGMTKHLQSGFDFDSAFDVVDGNQDGLINLSDITEIGRNFNLALDGYYVYGSTDSADVEAAQEATGQFIIADIPKSMLAGDGVNQRRFISITFPTLQTGMYYWVRPYGADAIGAKSNAAKYNPALVAAFDVEPRDVTFLRDGTLGNVLLSVAEDTPEIELDLWLEDAVDIKAFAANVYFDPAQYTPVDFTAANYLNPGLASNSVLDTFSWGLAGNWLIGNPYPLGLLDGFDGNWNLLKLHLTPQAQTEPDNFSPDCFHVYTEQIACDYDGGSNTFSWRYPLTGDVDQDGMVVVDDCIIVNYYIAWGKDQIAGGLDYPAMYDVNWDGIVSIIDYPYLGHSLYNAVDGFGIYASMSAADIPEYEFYLDELVVPTELEIGWVAYTAGTGDPASEQLRYSATLPDLAPGTYIWIMPTWEGRVGNAIEASIYQVPEE